MKLKIVNLETERLLLRKFKEEDANDYAEFMSDKHMWTYQPDHTETREDYLKDFPNLLKSYRKRNVSGMLRYAINLKSKNKVIGYIGIAINFPNNLGRISWSLNSKFWHKGYATEAASAAINYMFNEYNLHRIELNVWQGNTASENLALRLGFKKEGMEREARLKGNKYLDSINFGILKAEWDDLHKNN